MREDHFTRKANWRADVEAAGGKADNKGALTGMAVVTGLAIAAGVIGNHDKHPSQPSHPNTPIERHGDHHGSTGMPSTEHLNKFTQEHGIKLN